MDDLDLDALCAKAQDATQSDWWVQYESADFPPFERYAYAICGPTDEGTLSTGWLSEEYKQQYGHQISDVPGIADAEHIATFDPPTVLALIERARAAEATLERVREAIARHPKCDRYEDSDPVSCGWKSAYASVLWALEGGSDDEHASTAE